MGKWGGYQHCGSNGGTQPVGGDSHGDGLNIFLIYGPNKQSELPEK
jgi:hypothetical protein